MAHTTGRAAALAVLFTQEHWEADAASVPHGYNEDGEEIDTATSAAIVEDEFTTLLEESEPQQRQTEPDSEPEPQLGLHTTAHFDGSPPLLPPLHDLRRTVATAGESHSTFLARPASNPFLY